MLKIVRITDPMSIGHDLKKEARLPSLSLNDRLHEEYKKNKPGRKNKPDDFQHPKGCTIVIFGHRDIELMRFVGKISKKKVNKLASRYPDAVVQVDLGNGLSKTIPIKTFKKLIKIKFVILDRDFEFCSPDEFGDSMSADWLSLPDKVSDHIYSVNQLIHVLVMEAAYHKAMEHLTYAKFYLLIDQENTMSILYHSGKTESMSMEDFVDKYDLDFEPKFLS